MSSVRLIRGFARGIMSDPSLRFWDVLLKKASVTDWFANVRTRLDPQPVTEANRRTQPQRILPFLKEAEAFFQQECT